MNKKITTMPTSVNSLLQENGEIANSQQSKVRCIARHIALTKMTKFNVLMKRACSY